MRGWSITHKHRIFDGYCRLRKVAVDFGLIASAPDLIGRAGVSVGELPIGEDPSAVEKLSW